MSIYVNYSLDASIADFFTKTSVTREVCDGKAASLVGGRIIPVPIQGSCSYTVYGGPQLEFVVQFRLEPLPLSLKTAALARKDSWESSSCHHLSRTAGRYKSRASFRVFHG